MKILRAADHKRMPWKNGRGETVEIAVFPQGATVDTFDWRISMAAVAEDGPFSVFPDIDRSLSILDGRGMELTVEDQAVFLTQASPPHRFPADAKATARLMDGAITDLNVMTRRGRFSHGVEKLASPASLKPGSELTLVFCHRGELMLSTNKARETLGELDCAVLVSDRNVELSGTGEGFVVRIVEHG
jgi:uncharacterized protein